MKVAAVQHDVVWEDRDANHAHLEGMVAEAADQMTDCDCLMLGQFSMTNAMRLFTDMPERPVLTSAHTAVRKLKRLLG